jgi:hypothetical protein
MLAKSVSLNGDRLAGATLIAPVVNYWWKGFPANLSSDAYYKQQPQDQWSLRVAHYVSWLTFWWNIQKWFPAASVVANKPENIFSRQDFEIISKLAGREMHVHHQVLYILFLYSAKGVSMSIRSTCITRISFPPSRHR